MRQETKDPACAVCGNLIERGQPRYNRIVDGEFTSVHVECHKREKPPPA